MSDLVSNSENRARVCRSAQLLHHGCLVLFLAGLLITPALGQVSVLTAQNDNARSGANLNETVLNTSNVNVNQFGRLFSRSIDGYLYAQPLYVSNVAIPGQGVHNVVYVATMHNSVYAFDADDPQAAATLWKASLEPSIPLPDPNIGKSVSLFEGLKTLLSWITKNSSSLPALLNQLGGEGFVGAFALLGPYDKQIAIEVGSVSTPVISLEHNVLYCVTSAKGGNTYAHYLHA